GRAMGDHVGLGQAGAGPRHDITDNLLAVDRVRYAHRGRVLDGGVLEQHGVDLERGDIDAAADDQILAAAGDADKSVRVHDPEVAGLDALAADRLDRAVIPQIADAGMRP